MEDYVQARVEQQDTSSGPSCSTIGTKNIVLAFSRDVPEQGQMGFGPQQNVESRKIRRPSGNEATGCGRLQDLACP